MPTLKASDKNAVPTSIPSLPIVGPDGRAVAEVPHRRLPSWLKRPLPASGGMGPTAQLIEELGLETICESGKCPNRSECWTRKTASFMILGEVCTRPCGFCSVPRGKPDAPASDEPDRLAEACARLGLRHVVITSVTRDDLPDGGAEHFRRCILAVRERTGAVVEVLTPDFDGDTTAIDIVLSASPEVFNHNLETVARLQRYVRRKSQYAVSLAVLNHAKHARPDLLTKSGLMLGLGETTEEVIETMSDLRDVGCDLLTIGQYLRPSPKHLPVERYLPPEEFDELGQIARSLGFLDVASGPFVRSSYHADRMAASSSGDQPSEQLAPATFPILPTSMES
ncbi:lipoyl synthase [Tautonia rosea]|uniref:lipoyl synthase n=1 Tax=Tautonia rosea TaxID=2728037 RepID=UPI0014728093